MCDIVDDDGAVRISVVHGRQGLVSFLASRVPDLEFDSSVLVERNGLCEEGGTDGGFSVGVELVLYIRLAWGSGLEPWLGMAGILIKRTFTNRNTIELCNQMSVDGGETIQKSRGEVTLPTADSPVTTLAIQSLCRHSPDKTYQAGPT